MRRTSSFRSPAGVLLVAVILLLAGFRTTADDDRGKVVFDTVCSTCHSLTPPASKAPPMIMIAGHYVDARETEDAARTAMREWLTGPAADKSLLPAHAIERFGLMPPLALPDEDRRAVVEYIFAQRAQAGAPEPRVDAQAAGADTSGCGCGQCRMRGNMQGMQGQGMQGGMQCQGMQGGMRGRGMQGNMRGMRMGGRMQRGMRMHGNMKDMQMQGGMQCQGMQCQGMQGMMHGQPADSTAMPGHGMMHGNMQGMQMQGMSMQGRMGATCPMHQGSTGCSGDSCAMHRHGNR